MKLKIGQQFEVVEVLTGEFQDGSVKVGGHTIMLDNRHGGSGNILANGRKSHIFSKSKIYGAIVAYAYNKEVKPVGRLTVTKVK